MLRFASQLSDDNEYAVIWWGQSNARPWGTWAEGFGRAPHLDTRDRGGRALTALSTQALGVYPLNPLGNNLSLLYVTAPSMSAGEWQGAKIRIPFKAGTTGMASTVGGDIVAPIDPHVIVSGPVTATVTMTLASPCVVTWTGHTRQVNDPVWFTTSGTLLTGISPNTIYYVSAVVDPNSFRISATPGGPDINTSGSQSGFHTGHGLALATLAIASPGVVGRTAHGLSLNTPVWFTTSGDLPDTLVPGTVYYVSNVVDPNNFRISATPGGADLNFTGTESGTHRLHLSPPWTADQWLGHSLTMGGKTGVVVSNTTTTITLFNPLVGVWVGGTPTAGYFTINDVRGYGTVVTNSAFSTVANLTILWDTNGAPPQEPLGTVSCYLVREDNRYKKYDSIRMLVPYQPELLNVGFTAPTIPYPTWPSATITVTIASPGVVTWTAHGLPDRHPIRFTTTGALPTGIVAGTTYYTKLLATSSADHPNKFQISATPGGTAINTTGSESGVHTAHASPVPGYSFPTSISSFEDAGLFLPFTFLEGMDGQGAIGNGVWLSTPKVYADVNPHLCSQKANSMVGGYIRAGHSRARIASNTAKKTATVTFTGTGSANITWASHGFTTANHVGFPLSFTTTGTLPAEITQSQTYYIKTATPPDTLTISATPGGAAITFATAGTSVHTGHASGEITIVGDDAGWVGGPPSGYVATAYQLWIGHYNDNPHAWDAGDGFRYPTNDFQPGGYNDAQSGNPSVSPDGLVHNMARGANVLGGGGTLSSAFANYTYNQRFGAMIEFGYRLSSSLGKRINIIALGINSSGQYPAFQPNLFTNMLTIGWFDPANALDWSPTTPDGLFARLQKMIFTMAPAALTAEGNSKPLKILGMVGFQGEADALVETGREIYDATLSHFYSLLRQQIVAAGMSPYDADVSIPFVHARVSHTPYELVGSFTGYIFGNPFTVVLNGDDEGIVNKAIEKICMRDPFAATFDVDDEVYSDHEIHPKGGDVLHYNGVGEALNGQKASDAMTRIIDDALSFAPNQDVIDICNVALSHIGETALVTSFDPAIDGSVQASLCSRFYPTARDSLLQMKQWGFALRRSRMLVPQVEKPDAWDYAYAVPEDALNVIAVQPEDAGNDYLEQVQDVMAGQFSPVPVSVQIPADFTLEQGSDGERVLYTDLPDAVIRYVKRVADPKQFSPLFRKALEWHLASMLAGTIIKGEEGARMATRCSQMVAGYLRSAAGSDGNQRQVKPASTVPWIAGR